MDQGTPLNPEIDLGQVEGGFVMALGLFFSEVVSRPPSGSSPSPFTNRRRSFFPEVVSHSPSGAPTTLGTWEDKVRFRDTSETPPRHLRDTCCR